MQVFTDPNIFNGSLRIHCFYCDPIIIYIACNSLHEGFAILFHIDICSLCFEGGEGVAASVKPHFSPPTHTQAINPLT